jgi:Ca2+-binding RTX toxin-like protein
VNGKRIAGVCAAVVAAGMGLCQTASAGTVAYQSFDGRGQPSAAVFFTASPGETNDTTVTLTPTAAVITDPGNALQPDPAFAADTANHCTFSADKAVCRTDTPYPFTEGVVSLGDGNDRGRVIASAPNQTAVGSWPLETGELYGGPGADVLIGSAGDDWLVGGPGADDVQGGGGVRDWAAYSQDGDQTTGVEVSLDESANDGHQGEHDNVHSDVEFIDGTLQGDNVLTGGATDNALFGHQGSDVLRGGAGNDELHGSLEPGPGGTDVLDGGLGLDTFLGSDGDDVIHARDGLPDLRITCNGGNDVVDADPTDKPDPDCETVRTG